MNNLILWVVIKKMMYNYPFFSFPSFRNYNYYQSKHDKYTSNAIKPIPSKTTVRENQNMFYSKNSNFNIHANNSNFNAGANVGANTCTNASANAATNTGAITCTNASANTGANLKKSSEIRKDSNEVFEIFGIKLHFDDILLICLIFFLYSEGVKDDYLFISLILLLLS